MKPKILSLAPRSHINWMFDPALWDELNRDFDVVGHDEARHLAPDECVHDATDCAAVITGWGAKPFTPQWLEAAPNLKIVAHTAGSPRGLFSDETVREILIPRGIQIYTGADGMGANVAEQTIGMMIATTRRFALQAQALREKQTTGATAIEAPARDAQYLTGATVGLVSASKVARQVIPLLHAFGCRVLVYDPFLRDEAARELGVESVGLLELFERSDIVSLHAPHLPETQGLVTAELLSKLRDGASFINTSRGTVVDQDALLKECQSGRIFAALDVTTPEPLPPDSPFWELENVQITPHIAGQGRAGYRRIGAGAAQAIRDALAGREIVNAVPLSRWETVA